MRCAFLKLGLYCLASSFLIKNPLHAGMVTVSVVTVLRNVTDLNYIPSYINNVVHNLLKPSMSTLCDIVTYHLNVMIKI